MFRGNRSNNIFRLGRTKDHVALLALRLVCICVLVALLTLHIRFVRVFRWERSVSGGLVVTYVLAVVALGLCAGTEACGAKVLQYGLRSVYGFRLLVLALIVAMMGLHFRFLRTLRLDQPRLPGIVMVGNVIAFIALSVCVGMGRCGFKEVKAYLCGTGAVLLAINAVIIWRHWRRSGDLTRVVTELLGVLGVPVRRQIILKATLSATAALLLLIDLTWTLMQPTQH